MNINTTIRFLCCAALLIAAQFPAAAQNSFSDSEADGIKAFLHDNFRQTNACMVIGLADQRGIRIFGAGELDNGTDRHVNGDTVFFIGSVSKTFTALLLQDAVEREEMKLNDPVAKYLPTSIKMPTHGGKEITLLDLATHAAGFPADPDNMTGENLKEQYETYTVEKMYAFLSGYTLSRDPGTEFECSNVGMALLGHVIALRAGTNLPRDRPVCLLGSPFKKSMMFQPQAKALQSASFFSAQTAAQKCGWNSSTQNGRRRTQSS